MIDAQLSNLLGSLTLALADAQLNAVQAATGHGNAACAALVALGHYPDLSIREIAVIAGLSHSVMVRTIEALAANDLVAKRPGRDKREALCHLTAKGEALKARLIAARAASLGKVLSVLSQEEQGMLRGILAKMLVDLTVDRDQSDHLCRLCDEVACGPHCPVEQRVQAMFPEARHPR